MESIVFKSLLVVIFITVLGCIPYGIWVIISMVKRRWRRVALQIGIPAAFYAALFGTWLVCREKVSQDELAGVYGTEAKLGPAIFEYDSDRAFNGDGYSFAVYELPESIRKRFETADAAFLATYPIRPEYRSKWQSTSWMEAPLDPAYNAHLDFALSSYDSEKAPKMAAHFEAVRRALSRKGAYYACFYNSPSGSHINDIDLFVVDLGDGRLYIINQNT